MEVSKFNGKLNKLDGKIYTIEEEIILTEGVYDGPLAHDNINKKTLNIYTGSMLTGDKITNYFLSTPSETPWKNTIKIFSTVSPVYISYETTGDQVEAEDINNVQNAIVDTQNNLNSVNDNLNNEVDRAKRAEDDISNTINVNKPNWDDKYSRAETDNKISAVVTNLDWKEAVQSYNDISTTYPTPDDGWTVNVKATDITYRYDGSSWIPISANSIPLATKDIDGKMAKEDKAKIDGVQENANNYVHPDKHPATIIEEDATHRFVSDEEKAAIQNVVGGVDLIYPIAGGTGTAIILTLGTLVNGYSKTFIASASNGGVATTINGKPVYKPITTIPPNFVKDKAYTVWYNLTGGCFFIKASAEGDAIASNVLAGKKFSNDNDTGLVGTLDLSKLVTENIKNGVTINGVSGKLTVVDTQDAILIPEALLTGYSGYDDGVKKAGTMPNRGAYTASVSVAVGGTTAYVRIPQGAYLTNTSGGYPEITMSDGNFISSNILSGKSIFGLAGSIINRSAENWHQPSSSDCTSSANGYGAYIQPPQGYYDGNSWVRSLQPDLFAQNIISGKNIFGIGGTASIASLGGKKCSSGTVNAAGGDIFKTVNGYSGTATFVDITGFSIFPNMVFIVQHNIDYPSVPYYMSSIVIGGMVICEPGGAACYSKNDNGNIIISQGRLRIPITNLSVSGNKNFDYYIFE